MATIDLRQDATQSVKWGSEPALATRVSIPNVNLLNTKGSILYGTGGYIDSEAIGGNTYRYAEVKALNPTSVKSVLLNDGSGNLSWINVVDDLTTNDGNKVLSAKVGYDIDGKIHISEAKATPGITMGAGASTEYNSSIAIGRNTIEGKDGTGFSTILGNGASVDGAADCVAIGNGARVEQTTTRRYSSIQLGNGKNITPYSFQVWNTPMLVNGKIPLSSLSPTITVNNKTGLILSNGQTDKTMSYDGTVVLGPQAVVTGQEGVAIGNQAIVVGSGIAIGGGNVTANGSGVAIGAGAEAGTEGIAIGSATFAGENSIAIGDLAEAANETIQLGRFESTFLFRVGNYDVMGKDGQILAQRLTNALSSIYQRLDDLGFKEGVAEITQTNCTISTNSLKKMGKWCIFNFEMSKRQNENYTIAITIPEGFRPKETTQIVLLAPKSTMYANFFKVLTNGKVVNATSATEFTPGYGEQYMTYNAWWELP